MTRSIVRASLCVALVAVLAASCSTAFAQHTQFSAGFNLPDTESSLGGPLYLEDNPPGSGTAFVGTILTPWVVDSGPVESFQISGGEIAVGSLGVGVSTTISRGVTYGLPLSTQYFSAKMTQVEDNHLPYEAAAGFSVSGTPILRFGITANDSFDAANDEFFLELGGVIRHTGLLGAGSMSPGVNVAPNTPYWLVGSVTFDAAGNEVAKLWSNAMNPANDAPILTVSAETNATVLGDRMFFSASTQEPNTLKTFDNLHVAHRFSEVNGTRHDLDVGASGTQSGYASQDFVGWTGAPVTKNIDVKNDWGWQGFDSTLDVTAEAISGTAGTISSSTPATEDWVAENLIKDGISVTSGDSGGIRLTFDFATTEESGTMFLETYHFGSTTDIDIFVKDAAHGAYTKVGFVHHNDPDLTFAGTIDTIVRGPHGFIELSTDGINPNFVEFRPTAGSSGTVVLNGFALTPEPSTAMLMVLGLLGTLGFGRRHCRRGA